MPVNGYGRRWTEQLSRQYSRSAKGTMGTVCGDSGGPGCFSL